MSVSVHKKHKNINRSLIPNSPKLEPPPKSEEWIKNLLYSHTMDSNKKEYTTDTYDNEQTSEILCSVKEARHIRIFFVYSMYMNFKSRQNNL